jgi:hypothetical protein
MKSLQSQNPWTLQSTLDGTGRRRLILARDFPQPAPRRRIALRRKGMMKLSVSFAPEELSGFELVIRSGA